ncbi:MAG: KH domain-containing protein [Clostridia bacterium]|nr:KH domain-containing protein [Clostridia bacterium]
MKEAEGVGKTYEEALADGLKKIGLPKEKVSVEIVKEPKKRLFSILEAREVKVKLTEIEEEEKASTSKHVSKEYVKPSTEDIENAKNIARTFLNDYFSQLGVELDINMSETENALKIDITGDKAGLIIGYRGETLEALQVMIANIVNKGTERRVRVVVDAEGYRAKREKTLEELAHKVASTVVSRRKSFTLEPMVAFERKVIHEALQNHPKVKTMSVGEEPYRKVVISLK